MAQLEPKCSACQRTTATHAPGCSLTECPNRRPRMWGGPEGSQGFPGQLSEDRLFARRGEKHLCVEVDLNDL